MKVILTFRLPLGDTVLDATQVVFTTAATVQRVLADVSPSAQLTWSVIGDGAADEEGVTVDIIGCSIDGLALVLETTASRVLSDTMGTLLEARLRRADKARAMAAARWHRGGSGDPAQDTAEAVLRRADVALEDTIP